MRDIGYEIELKSSSVIQNISTLIDIHPHPLK